jgi:3-deoxy-D-manno-octulosonate 8-phosphate phosphatase (KDO 8-P phosphatase)
MGDDVNDLPALELAAVPACPHDAVPEVRNACSFVSRFDGGRGAVRELCEAILGASVGWPPPEPSPDAFKT